MPRGTVRPRWASCARALARRIAGAGTALCGRATRALGLVAVTTTLAPVAQAELPGALDAALARFGIEDTAVSVVVLDDDGRTIVSHLPDIERHPGSTVKLVTTFGVLAHLSPIHTFRTRAYHAGTISDGRLDGDLYLEGGGDPYLTTDGFWRFVRAVRREGVTEIAGDLVIDTSYYDLPAVDPGAFDGQPYRLYNTQPYPLIVNFKAHDFVFRPRGQRVAIETDPELANLEIDNRLTVTRGPCNVYQAGIAMHAIGDTRVRFEGRMPSGCRVYHLSRTFMPPAAYAYGLFVGLYAEMGGTVTGGVREGDVPTGAKRLVEFDSPPLREIIVAVNKYSNNVMTRMLMLNLGAELFGPPATVEKGTAALKEVYSRLDIDMAGVTIDNGSGLSRRTRISAGKMAEILVAARRSPWAAEFVSSMPLSGLDGTLRRRLKSSTTRGNSHLKTGRLDGVSALAGYVHDGAGDTYTVVFFMNHPKAHRGVGNVVGDALVTWVHGLEDDGP